MHKIIIANLVLEPESRTLTNQFGHKVMLRPLPYEVFRLLLDQQGKSVSRDQLFNVCWEGMVVTDQALTNVISNLRRNLVQLKAENVTIKTVSKIGYLLAIEQPITIVENTNEIAPLKKQSESSSVTNKVDKKEAFNRKTADAILKQLWTKPSFKSVGCCFLLVAMIIVGVVHQRYISIPHFLVSNNYEHFSVNNTDFYLLNKTKEKTDIEKVKTGIESLNLAECNANVYIRMYDSVYEDDTYSLKGYIEAKNNNRNGNYSLSQFSYDNLPNIIGEALKRAKLVCD
ncbi:winged helix-turn-helix domain-containing protein [Aliivibrio fischeri]|uniref:Transcriptional regulatory protein n=1 Tax=Aliivibrio fischeri SR5 TaxID=1088719 RepID=A0AAV3EVD2_ALIFS|nr:winged helix-turn-helix domain-containing protein [Aliivibrio fischeri]EHN70726.1 transcriptional regulatory protein [Aliivibrio fischeri SR5]MUK26096.1 transcriptional regulator [Aliivibrio fischeri]MUK33939.1 transcriptional regulator [Aliivibrio fischeri]MUL01135.1 transcriptional regulator [Aliivibrio fischeri]